MVDGCLQVYICRRHGEVLSDEVIWIINPMDDDEMVCGKCKEPVKPKMIDKSYVYEKVNHERWERATTVPPDLPYPP